MITLLYQSLPEFQSTVVAPALSEGAVHHSEIIRFGKILGQELSDIPANHFLLILDDLHLIEGSDGSTELIRTLIQNTPHWIQWILISRQSIKHVLRVGRFNFPTLRIENSELNFSIEESAELFQSIFSLSVPLPELQKIQEQTEGWVTGLVLTALGQKMTGDKTLKDRIHHTIARNRSQSHLIDFFLQDVLSITTEEQLQTIFQLVLLEDIPELLLNDIFGEETSGRILKEMEEKNFFFRCIDNDRKIYSFHHLFLESMRTLAKKTLSQKSQERVFSQAIKHHLKCGEPLRALHYATCSNDIDLCEEILSDLGFQFLHANNIKSLQHLLETFAEGTISNYPWLSYYYGACIQDTIPAVALPHLLRAQALFSEQHNELGLLFTNTQLVEFHVMIDGQFNLMRDYLIDLESIFLCKHETLPSHFKLRIAHALALGYCFLQLDMQKAAYYDTMALNLSNESHSENMIAMIRLIRAYRCCFTGDVKGVYLEAEALLPFIRNPRVTTFTRLYLQLLQINLLEMIGDFSEYRYQKITFEQRPGTNYGHSKCHWIISFYLGH